MRVARFVTKEFLWRAVGYAKRAAFISLAVIGFFCIGFPVACTVVRPAFYAEENFQPIIAPGGKLSAYRSVTTGGFATVWTTRIFISEVPKGESFVIYETRDSDYVPNFRWLGSEMLLVELPCDRVDFLSNSSDFNEGDTPMQRVAVRFTYPDSCNPMLLARDK